MTFEDRYVRFKADETRLADARDDGRITYLAFSDPVGFDLDVFDQDGRSLAHAVAGRVVAVDGLHAGLLVRRGERSSFVAPDPRVSGSPRPAQARLPDAELPDYEAARARLESRSLMMQAMTRALNGVRGRQTGEAERAPGAAPTAPPHSPSHSSTPSGVAGFETPLPATVYGLPPARWAVPGSGPIAQPIRLPAPSLPGGPSAVPFTPSGTMSTMSPRSPPSPLAPLALANASTVAPEQGLVRVFFATASRAIVAPEDGLGLLLREAAHADEIRVTGFTDATGSPATNEALARARADTLVRILVRRGIPRERIYSSGVSGSGFIAENTTDRGRALNRRAEVVLLRNGAPVTIGSRGSGWR